MENLQRNVIEIKTEQLSYHGGSHSRYTLIINGSKSKPQPKKRTPVVFPKTQGCPPTRQSGPVNAQAQTALPVVKLPGPAAMWPGSRIFKHTAFDSVH